MTVAAFILGVLGFGTAVASLTWQVYTFLMQGARPKLTPIIGMLVPGGVVIHEATQDARTSLVNTAQQLPSGLLVVGVKVVNAGRAPFHVAGWEVHAEPTGPSLKSIDVPPGGAAAPHDIPPGAEAMFITDLEPARALLATSEKVFNKKIRLVVRVESGGRTYASKPIASVNLTIG